MSSGRLWIFLVRARPHDRPQVGLDIDISFSESGSAGRSAVTYRRDGAVLVML